MSRTYVITGTASGIGKATKELLEEAGHRVIGIGRRDTEIIIDLADPAQRATMADRVAEASGGAVDVVMAVAGSVTTSPSDVQVNYFAARETVESLRPLLLKSPAPRAVVVSSISAVHPDDPELTQALRDDDEKLAMSLAARNTEQGTGGYNYTSSKRAISEWVRSAAVAPEWAGAGIPLNNVAPATFITGLTEKIVTTPEGRAMLAKTTPMPLHGPGEAVVVARLLAWITSEANTHLTGQAVFIDGGCEAVLRGPRVFGKEI
ncbi:SDR family oxidoreductase [Actinospica sp. MGRD01-02]|uniref:SDR family oxidoreductase n=1 Tax=Actinospica acidithermotolerans TaxID=2828514 RepID=A0A941E829_9ACTN|nr:SDR family oxidoreductase [Actinospica acidithermotolerans]MBR7825683.1 SDR family oxidoreductase [Actinospica acidithermotolerans]